MDTNKKLYKSETDKKIAGVCGGIAAFFGFDATWLRIALVIFTFAGGAGILLYVIAAIVMPKDPGTGTQNQGYTAQNQGYTPYQEAPAQESAENAAPDTPVTETWLCECGTVCNTPFCQQCGRKKPEPEEKQENKF